MTPEQDQMLDEVYDFIVKLKSSQTIPLEVDRAFRARLASSIGLVESGLASSAHRQSVNEAGSSTYKVLPEATGFLTFIVNGTTRYIPYY